MLYVYGSLMPLRWLEEIRFWKMQEKEHTVVIRELAPTLEPGYVALLQQWEGAFARTEAEAIQWIEAVLRSPLPLSPSTIHAVQQLLFASMKQSEEWIRQLFFLEEHSKPVKTNAVVKTVTTHIIRESEYFLGVLQAASASSAGRTAIGDAAEQTIETNAAARRLPVDGSGGSAAPASVSADGRANGRAGDRGEVKEAYLHRLAEPGPASRPGERSLYTATQEGLWSEGSGASNGPGPSGTHRLPPLPYAYDALEPYIDAETMRLHHTEHHRGCVEALNRAERMLAHARESGEYGLIRHWEREAAYYADEHALHTLFWLAMKPRGGGEADGPIAAELTRSFGSQEAFRQHFAAAADGLEGNGWALLVWNPQSRRLEIAQETRRRPAERRTIPLLALDAWEHAYYLKHRNNRRGYIEQWWSTVNWDYVNNQFVAARKIRADSWDSRPIAGETDVSLP